MNMRSFKPRVFFSHTVDELGSNIFPEESLERIRRIAHVRANSMKRHLTPSELIRECVDTDIVITEWATGVDEAFFSSCKTVKLFVRSAATTGNIDLEAAKKYGVSVAVTPPFYVAPLAEMMLGSIIFLSQKLHQLDADFRVRRTTMRTPSISREVNGKTVGIVGLGKVGRALKERLHVLGVNIVVHDPGLRDAEAVDVVALEELLMQSDIVVVCARVTSTAKPLITREHIRKLRKGALVINAAQPGLVDEVALAEALRSQHLGGAAIDVYSGEPDVRNNPLFDCPNTILTPHIGGHTIEGYRQAAEYVADTVERFVAGP